MCLLGDRGRGDDGVVRGYNAALAICPPCHGHPSWIKSDAWQGAACRLEQILEYVFGSGVGSTMGRREFIRLVGGAAVGWPLASRAQQAAMPIVGFLSSRSPKESEVHAAAFRRGLLARADEVIE
jgi:hypothetical protein